MDKYDIGLVDEIRRRLDCSYEDALLGLEAGESDLARSLAAAERIKSQREGAQCSGEMIGKAIALAREGRLKGLRVKLGDRVVGEAPLPKGPAGGALGAVLSLLLARVSVELVIEEAPPQEEHAALRPASGPGED
jgi:hypothetical protein